MFTFGATAFMAGTSSAMTAVHNIQSTLLTYEAALPLVMSQDVVTAPPVFRQTTFADTLPFIVKALIGEDFAVSRARPSAQTVTAV